MRCFSLTLRLVRNRCFTFNVLSGCFLFVILAYLLFISTNNHKYLEYEVVANVTKNEVDRNVLKKRDVTEENNRNRDTRVTQKETKTERSENIYDAQLNNDHTNKAQQLKTNYNDQGGQQKNGHKDQDAPQSNSQWGQGPSLAYDQTTTVNYLSAEISNEQNGTPSKDNKSHVSISESPQWFRKAVTVITELMKEYEPKLTGVANVPKHYFEPRKEVIQQLIEAYRITPSASFQKNCPYLLALQMSILDRWSERDAVRSTWASVVKEQKWPNRRVNAEVKILFVVADLEDNKQQEFKRVQEEASEYNDILYIAMQDSYRNLTLKIVSSFKWVKEFCPCVKFVLKVDADTFVNVPLLVDTLMANEEKFDYAIGGFVYQDPSPVLREGRWAVSEKLYPMSIYPTYTSGCSYILSKKVVAKVAEVAPYVLMLPIEEAYITGVLRVVIQCKMFSLMSYFAAFIDEIQDPCEFFYDNKIVGTGVDYKKRQVIWETFLNNGTTCYS